MSKMYPHICGTCASRLVLDKENSVFNCPACGNTYDYDYFMEDEVFDKAGNSLAHGEYASALNLYEFMLSKEPHNAVALRGKLLCKLHVTSPAKLVSNDISHNVDMDPFIQATPAKYKEFFESICQLRSVKRKKKTT